MIIKMNYVLLVDDNIAANFFNKKVLSILDIAENILTAENGEIALRVLSEQEEFPELILLDINMPVMDGWKFLDMFSKLEPKGNVKTKVVLLTASTEDTDRERAEAMGAGYQLKPLTKEAMKSVIEKYFPVFIS